MLTAYLIAVTVVFIFLAIIWKTDNWLNVLFKVTFFSGFVGGLLLSLAQFGLIVKV